MEMNFLDVSRPLLVKMRHLASQARRQDYYAVGEEFA